MEIVLTLGFTGVHSEVRCLLHSPSTSQRISLFELCCVDLVIFFLPSLFLCSRCLISHLNSLSLIKAFLIIGGNPN
jgi:hypothetical protein